MENLKVWFAASEVEPFVKTGGLADVAGSLPKALARAGVDVRVVMPKYGQIDRKLSARMEFVGSTEVDLTWRKQYCGVYMLEHDGVKYYFIDNEFYFNREWYYGLGDDGERFAFFCKAILEVLPVIGFQPDILHLNDWQTGMVSILLDAHYRHFREGTFYRDMHTVLTIHNLRYQGIFPSSLMDGLLGLDWKFFHLDGVEYYGNINFLKAGIAYSTRISTVSRTYAEEIRGEFYGENLQGIINKRTADLVGIVNGIDYQRNDPANDPRLHAPFTAEDLSGKALNKAKLQEACGIEVRPDVPLIGIISRLVDQKGFDLIDHVLGEMLDWDVQFVLLGTGDKKYEDLFRWAQATYPGKMSSNIRYDAVLAQRIYAASDLFLMPSLFEPCGLSQIFSMRYGTVPIVRETGGLKDTVVPFDVESGEGTGFTFENYNAHDMKDTVARAIEAYGNSESWNRLVRNCMAQDFSWQHSAKEYISMYQDIMKTFSAKKEKGTT